MESVYKIDPDFAEMASSVDVINEKHIQVISQIQQEEEKVYRSAIAKRFGEFSEDNAKKCSLRMAGRIKQLMCGEDLLCEIYPFEQPTFPGSTATNQVVVTLKYRIF